MTTQDPLKWVDMELLRCDRNLKEHREEILRSLDFARAYVLSAYNNGGFNVSKVTNACDSAKASAIATLTLIRKVYALRRRRDSLEGNGERGGSKGEV